MLKQFSTHSFAHCLFYCCTLSILITVITLYNRANCTPSKLHNIFLYGLYFASTHNYENLCHCFLCCCMVKTLWTVYIKYFISRITRINLCINIVKDLLKPNVVLSYRVTVILSEIKQPKYLNSLCQVVQTDVTGF